MDRSEVVKVEQMTRKEFNEDRCIQDLGPDEYGYRVVYSDGYVSWRPKAERCVDTPVQGNGE